MYEILVKEKTNNDSMGNEEIQKQKSIYEDLLEGERVSKEEIKKKAITTIDDIKM